MNIFKRNKSIFSLSPDNPNLLNETNCKQWAAMAYWRSMEALLLSMGFDPQCTEEIKTPEGKIKIFGEEFSRRLTLFLEAFTHGEFADCKIPLSLPDGSHDGYGFPPLAFSEWALKNFRKLVNNTFEPFPKILYSAVIQHHNNCPKIIDYTHDTAPSTATEPTVNDDVTACKTIVSNITSDKAITLQGDTSGKGNIRTQIARENGHKKGQAWREFAANTIKSAVERELKTGCNCLHKKLADILADELIAAAKKELNPLVSKLTEKKLLAKIEDAIKDIFLDFGTQYNNARARVYRGKYYSEYDKKPCIPHSGK